MKIRVKLVISAALGLLVAFGPGLPSRAQFDSTTIAGADALMNSNLGGLQQVRIPPSGIWAEVINVTSKWIVIQIEDGQQFPIAADHVRQFLIRWPSSAGHLQPGSLVEVTGPSAGSNVIIADHIDHYEDDARGLVSPTVQDLFGYNRTLSSFDINQQNTYGAVYWLNPEEYSMPARLHVVGHPLGSDPVQISGFGQNWYTVQPGLNGMTVTRVTRGSNSFARRGDLVYVVPESIGQRSLDVMQLVLYKRIPIQQFQP